VIRPLSKTFLSVLLLTAVWLSFTYWAHIRFLPYDVKNTDVSTYLFQAQTFADGHLYRKTPEPHEFFQTWQIVSREKSYAYHPPVHPLFLSSALALHINPWFVPWTLGGLSIILLFVWVRNLSDEKTAWVASFLLALSPFFAANGPSLLSHSTTLFLTLLFLMAVCSWKENGKVASAFFAGALLSLIFGTRSANAAAIGVVWIPFVAYSRRKTLLSDLKQWIAFIAGGLTTFIPLLTYYRVLAGYWTLDLFKDYWPRNRFGFGKGLGRGEPGHYFQTSTDHDWNGFVQNISYDSKGLAEWWSGNLWLTITTLIIFFILIATRKIRSKKESSSHFQLREWPAITIWAVVHIVLYGFYFSHTTPATGPRHVLEVIPALALICSATIVFLYYNKNVTKWLGVGFIVAWIVLSIPFTYGFYKDNEKSLPLQRAVEDCVTTGAEKPALIFLRSFWIGHPFPIFSNRTELTDPIIFACDRGEEDKILIQKYPERNAYIFAVAPPTRETAAQIELVPLYRSKDHHWLMEPQEVESPFYVGSKFTSPLKLQGEEFRKLFKPKPEEIVPQ
jgi:4-amino-4-deoxy-L-arabinose transferase-like glycosyltransferase